MVVDKLDDRKVGAQYIEAMEQRETASCRVVDDLDDRKVGAQYVEAMEQRETASCRVVDDLDDRKVGAQYVEAMEQRETAVGHKSIAREQRQTERRQAHLRNRAIVYAS